MANGQYALISKRCDGGCCAIITGIVYHNDSYGYPTLSKDRAKRPQK
jgi:hypothetical protein